jgi:hypothetical protein
MYPTPHCALEYLTSQRHAFQMDIFVIGSENLPSHICSRLGLSSNYKNDYSLSIFQRSRYRQRGIP